MARNPGHVSISRTSLYVLAVIAVVAGVVGTYLSIQHVQSITGLYTGLSQVGSISFNEQGVMSLRLTDASSSFGNITSNNSGVCVVTTEGPVMSGINCYKTGGPDPMTVNNDGNLNITVTINATGFSLGTGGGQAFKATEGAPGICALSLASSYVSLPSSTPALVCDQLKFSDGVDDLTIDIRLTVGEDLQPGNQTENVTLWACLAGSGSCP